MPYPYSYAGLLPSIDAVERVRGALPPILRVREPSEPVAISIFEIARHIEQQRKSQMSVWHQIISAAAPIHR